ncbi:hypothetical protein [Paenibacillus hamazuiensis]|uniref:hypothetical protein n=1 Tax=Paenibacillus hamazuiensis TaxID=2936508 RepID=UPI00200DE6B8|nr:hypothetical protein [Paenibacillus hamazuiensis]
MAYPGSSIGKAAALQGAVSLAAWRPARHVGFGRPVERGGARSADLPHGKRPAADRLAVSGHTGFEQTV